MGLLQAFNCPYLALAIWSGAGASGLPIPCTQYLWQALPEETLGEHPQGRAHPTPHLPSNPQETQMASFSQFIPGILGNPKRILSAAGLTRSLLSSMVKLSSPPSSWSLWPAPLAPRELSEADLHLFCSFVSSSRPDKPWAERKHKVPEIQSFLIFPHCPQAPGSAGHK